MMTHRDKEKPTGHAEHSRLPEPYRDPTQLAMIMVAKSVATPDKGEQFPSQTM